MYKQETNGCSDVAEPGEGEVQGSWLCVKADHIGLFMKHNFSCC